MQHEEHGWVLAKIQDGAVSRHALSHAVDEPVEVRLFRRGESHNAARTLAEGKELHHHVAFFRGPVIRVAL